MKIAYDPQIFGWQRFGGISRYFFELTSRLAEMNRQEVKIFCPIYVNEFLEITNKQLTSGSIKLGTFPFSGRILRLVNEKLDTFGVKKFKPDLLHETYYSKKPIFPSIKKRIVTIHDMIHEKFPENFSKYDPTRSEKAASVARADHIICVSESTKKDLIEILNVKSEKISVIHLATSLVVPEPIAIRVNYNSKPFLLYVGNRGGHKNFDGLLLAYADSAFNNEYSIICFGGGGFSAKEIERARGLGIKSENLIHMFGNDQLLVSLYSAATLFIYPSMYEGFGIPLLEAMALGCPVATSAVSSIPEVAGNAAIYFDPNDPDSMRRSIEEVLANPKRLEEFGARGVERAKSFSWEKCANQTLDAYGKACG